MKSELTPYRLIKRDSGNGTIVDTDDKQVTWTLSADGIEDPEAHIVGIVTYNNRIIELIDDEKVHRPIATGYKGFTSRNFIVVLTEKFEPPIYDTIYHPLFTATCDGGGNWTIDHTNPNATATQTKPLIAYNMYTDYANWERLIIHPNGTYETQATGTGCKRPPFEIRF